MQAHLPRQRWFAVAALPLLFVTSTLSYVYEHVVVLKEEPIARLQGLVRDPSGGPVADVIVELFDDPERQTLPYEQAVKAKPQRKLGETHTSPKGAFRLPRVRRGKYELRFTKNGFNPLSWIVVVDPKAAPKGRGALLVDLPIGG